MSSLPPTRRLGRNLWLACLATGLPLVAVAAPTLAADAPATSAPAVADAPKADASAVLLTAFAAHGEGASGMAAAFADSLSNSLGARKLSTKSTSVGFTAGDTKGVSQEATAQSCRYAITGSIQSFGGEVRIAGQVLDASTGTVAGLIRASGPANQFFAVQDVAIAQASQAIGGGQPAAAAPAAAPVYTPPPSVQVLPPRTSLWGEYSDLYEPPVTTVGNAAYPPYPPPQPPAPPMYSYGYNAGLYGGGGSYDGGEVIVGTPLPVTVGTIRTQTFNSLGVSIIPNNSQQTTTRTPLYTTRHVSPVPLPPYAANISQYRNPTPPALVGLPQATRTQLRPGESGNPGTVTVPSPRSPSETRGGSGAGSSTVLRKL